eukprot:142853_1
MFKKILYCRSFCHSIQITNKQVMGNSQFQVILSILWILGSASQKDYFIDQRYNCNNVYGAVQNASDSTQWVQHISRGYNTERIYQMMKRLSPTTNCDIYFT